MKITSYQILLLLFTNIIYAQSINKNNFSSFYLWDTEVMLSEGENDANFSGGKQSITVNDNFVFVTWESVISQGNSVLNIRCSSDAASTWENTQEITSANSQVKKPVIKSTNSDVFIAWKDTRDNTDGEIYFKISRDYGISWSSDLRITSSVSQSNLPSLDTDGSNIYLVWEEIISQPLSAKCYMTKSHDRGVNWSDIMLVSDMNSTVEEGAPIVSADQNIVHIVFGSDRHSSETNGYNWEHYYRNSIDDGFSFGNPVRLTNDTDGDSRFPMVAASNTNIHVVWWDDRNDRSYLHNGYPPTPLPTERNYEIYYKRSLNNGVSWEEDVQLTNSPNISSNPSIAAKNNYIVVCWQDYRDGNFEIYVKYSTDAGTTWSEDTRITNDAGASEWPGVDLDDNGNIYLMWVDDKSGKANIYFKKGNIQLTDIREDESLSHQFLIEQNYPNPFNPITIINYQIAERCVVSLKVFDLLGKEITTLVDEEKPMGRYTVTFNGNGLSSGFYLCKMQSGNFIDTKKLLLLK